MFLKQVCFNNVKILNAKSIGDSVLFVVLYDKSIVKLIMNKEDLKLYYEVDDYAVFKDKFANFICSVKNDKNGNLVFKVKQLVVKDNYVYFSNVILSNVKVVKFEEFNKDFYKVDIEDGRGGVVSCLMEVDKKEYLEKLVNNVCICVGVVKVIEDKVYILLKNVISDV